MEMNYIVAIDFGTSRTGFAWCVRGEIAGITDIKMRINWPGLPNEYPKTYSSLVKDIHSDRWYYGGEAQKIIEEGINFKGEKVTGDAFREYKMDLYDNRNAESPWKDKEFISQAVAEGGPYRKVGNQSYKTVDLIVILLKKIKEEVWDNMSANFGSQSLFSREMFDQEVQWVITVPAGATDESKYFMRIAAEKAGLINAGKKDFDRLLFALEPEAAIIACIKDDIGRKIIDLEQTIVVFDAGGGTVDVTARKYRPKRDGAPAKLTSVGGVAGECAPAGAKYADPCFIGRLREIFGEDVISELVYKHQEEYNELIHAWVKAKESTVQFRNCKEYSRKIDLSSLWEILDEKFPDRYNVMQEEIASKAASVLIRDRMEYKFSGRKYKYLTITPEVFEHICESVFEQAYEPLRAVLNNLADVNQECDTLFFVGGFSCCPFLREYVKNQIRVDFPSWKKIRFIEIESNKMSSAVLYGAVLFGDDPAFIADRIVSLTYGVDCVNEIFSPLILRGDKIRFDEELEKIYHPVEPKQVKVHFNFYSTERTDVKKTTDPSLKQLKDVTIDSPDTRRGLDRNIIIRLRFGGTETIATILDETTGNQEKVSLHIPFAWSAGR